jgi:hypothetical protein
VTTEQTGHHITRSLRARWAFSYIKHIIQSNMQPGKRKGRREQDIRKGTKCGRRKCIMKDIKKSKKEKERY